MRAYILCELELISQNLSQNLMFVFPSVAKLATYLHAVQTGSFMESQNIEETMHGLITKYSNLNLLGVAIESQMRKSS